MLQAAIDEAVQQLALKLEYKNLTGEEFKPAEGDGGRKKQEKQVRNKTIRYNLTQLLQTK
jgi:hypothetical protein